MKNFLIFLSSIVLAIGLNLFGAWALMKMYNLCILPLSTEEFYLPHISYAVWAMVYLFCGFIIGFRSTKKSFDTDYKEMIRMVISRIFTMLMYLFFAWIFNIIFI